MIIKKHIKKVIEELIDFMKTNDCGDYIVSFGGWPFLEGDIIYNSTNYLYTSELKSIITVLGKHKEFRIKVPAYVPGYTYISCFPDFTI